MFPSYLNSVEFGADVDENVVHVTDMMLKSFYLLIVHLHFAEKKSLLNKTILFKTTFILKVYLVIP